VKVAITSRGEDLDADVDPRFGRARYLIVYETDDDTFSVIDNMEGMNAQQGAGIQAAQNISNAGAVALITGNCGPKAFSVLQSAGVNVYVGASGKVKDAIQALKLGELTQADSHNVEGHWS
jgi:predicted Fe-Mo cluster-binding NifX family protein